MTRWHTKETCNGRFKEYHLTEQREGKLLRNLRLRNLFLRVPEKCMSLPGEQLPMWLPQSALRRPVSWIDFAHRIAVGEVKGGVESYCGSSRGL
jgi:hypothetical protein